MRYGLPTAQLAVSSITASIRFSSSANINVGIGPSESYAGNLVPLSGGVTYDENPTISYVPLQGMEHVRSLLSPVPLDLLGLLLNLNAQPQVALAMIVKRINGIPNADFLADASLEGDRPFADLLSAISGLNNEDKLTFFESSEEHKSYVAGDLVNGQRRQENGCAQHEAEHTATCLLFKKNTLVSLCWSWLAWEYLIVSADNLTTGTLCNAFADMSNRLRELFGIRGAWSMI